MGGGRGNLRVALQNRDAARHVATKTVGSAIDRCDAGLAWYVHGDGGGMGGGIFALRRPRPYSRHCEEIVAGMQRRLQFVPMGASMGTANGGITTRHWFGRALALLGTSPTKLLIDNRPPCRLHTHTVHPANGAPSVFVAMMCVVVKKRRIPLRGGVAGGSRCGAPLRPFGNGRIDFRPPYSKRESRRKARRGQSFIGGPSYG